MKNKTIRKKINELKVGDKVKLKRPSGERFIGTVKTICLIEKAITVNESIYDFYLKEVSVLTNS